MEIYFPHLHNKNGVIYIIAAHIVEVLHRNRLYCAHLWQVMISPQQVKIDTEYFHYETPLWGVFCSLNIDISVLELVVVVVACYILEDQTGNVRVIACWSLTAAPHLTATSSCGGRASLWLTLSRQDCAGTSPWAEHRSGFTFTATVRHLSLGFCQLSLILQLSPGVPVGPYLSFPNLLSTCSATRRYCRKLGRNSHKVV